MNRADNTPLVQLDIWKSFGPSKPKDGLYAVCLSYRFGLNQIIREFRTKKQALRHKSKCARMLKDEPVRLMCRDITGDLMQVFDKLVVIDE